MKKQIKLHIPIAEMIADTFGDDCEVVLHDIQNLEHSVVYVVNGHVTGRKVGQGLNHYVSKVILQKKYNKDQFSNYYFYSSDGRLIKSSTAILRDDSNSIIGVICINMDTTKITKQIEWLNMMIPNLSNEERVSDSQFRNKHIVELLDEIIDSVVENKDISTLTRKEKINLVRQLEKQGVFLMKGAINKVADSMGISKVTIYSYIDALR